MSCMPTGSCFPFSSTGSTGIEIAGSPARLTPTVYMSSKYIVKGSVVFSPILNAGVGVVGLIITSTFSNACA